MYFSFPVSNGQGAKILLTSLRRVFCNPDILFRQSYAWIFFKPTLKKKKKFILLFPNGDCSCREGHLSQRERGRKLWPLPGQRKAWRRQPKSTIRRVPLALSTSIHFQTLLAMFETALLNPFSTRALYLFREKHFNRPTTFKTSPIVSPQSLIEICIYNWLLFCESAILVCSWFENECSLEGCFPWNTSSWKNVPPSFNSITVEIPPFRKMINIALWTGIR